MKTRIYQKVKKEEKSIKKYFEILLLVFTLTSITVILALSNFESRAKEEYINTEDYVSVFKESELYEFIFQSSEEE